MICSNCSKQMGPGDRFCSRCGHALGDQGPAAGDDRPTREFRLPGQPSGGRSKMLAFLMVAALGAAGYYYFWQPHTQKEQKLRRPMETVKIIPPSPTPVGPERGSGGCINLPDSAREPGEGHFVDQFEEMLRDESEMRHGTGFYDNSSPDEYIDMIIGHIRYECRSEEGTNLPDSGSFSFDVHRDGTVSGSITLPTLVTLMSGTLSDSGELAVHGKNEAVDCRMSGHIDTRTTDTGFITGEGNFQLTDSSTAAVSLCEGEWSTLE